LAATVRTYVALKQRNVAYPKLLFIMQALKRVERKCVNGREMNEREREENRETGSVLVRKKERGKRWIKKSYS